MKKKTLIIVCAALSLLCTFIILIFGNTYTIKEALPADVMSLDQIEVSVEGDAVEIIDEHLENDTLYLTLSSIHKGKCFVDIKYLPDAVSRDVLYVHSFGVITYNTFFGRSTGSRVIPIFTTLYLVLILISRIKLYKKDVRENMYRYKNVKNIGLIIYLLSLVIGQAVSVLYDSGILKIANDILNSVLTFSVVALPIAFIVFVFVSISNIILMKKEGRNWRNMLGFFLGLTVCVSTLLPSLLSDYLQQSVLVDVHNEQGIALYIEMLIEAVISACVTYLECILLGTIILGVKAAKRIPSFDKDYILILGCQINSDGTLTPLLKGRTDRAIEFAKMQENDNGRKVVFVPSGGKGDDEVIAEGQAVHNYLIENGIPESRILTEDKSVSIFENLKYSMELIRKHSEKTEPKIAFSTTNYHVFRAGIIATKQGINAEGMGSKTKQYFFINAFVREFIATLVSEKRSHIKVMAVMLLIMVSSVVMVYLSNVM